MLRFTPVWVFGCVHRGLMALTVALLSAGAALVTTGISACAMARKDSSSTRWLLSTLILLLPIALLAGLLG